MLHGLEKKGYLRSKDIRSGQLPRWLRPGAQRRRPLRILLVEDERKVAKALQEGLEAESYSIAVAHTGDEGFLRVTSEPFDLAVLDVMLPGRSGIEMLSAMRSQGVKIPVLLLTAKEIGSQD